MVAAPSPAAAATTDSVETTTGCVASVPDPGSTEPVQICWSLFRPVSATASHPVPLVIQSHGWGGSRTTDPTWLLPLIDSGYGVLSFDQRGFGDSGGRAQMQDPDIEGRDIAELVDLVGQLTWVAQDGDGDPRLGAMGGSYGGGFQYLGAFTVERNGKPVFDALAPEYTWFDLEESLAPSGVVRTQWASFLAATSSDALEPAVALALAEGIAAGEFPASLHTRFERNGSKWQVSQGKRLDVPVLMGQGTTDTLFDLRQALSNWHLALTDRARARSILIGYDGGHTIGAVTGQTPPIASDPCSKELAGGDFLALTVRFFDEQLKHRQTGLGGYGRIHLGTPGQACATVDDDRPTSAYDAGTVVTPVSAGPQVATPIATGPLRVAGSPSVTADVTTTGPDARIFAGLAVGTSPQNATLVQDNVLPLRVATQVTSQRLTFDLPTVAVDVPAGQSLYLLTSPTNTVFAAMASRVPGLVTLSNTRVDVPVRDARADQPTAACRDTQAPTTTPARRHVRKPVGRRLRLRGIATDAAPAGCVASVASIQAVLKQVVGEQGCRYMLPHGHWTRVLTKRKCRAQTWPERRSLRVAGTTTWTFLSPGRLRRRATYVLTIRAIDRAGNREPLGARKVVIRTR
ncbi:MAG: CocE/NonD family hydrolase [Nocardioides sp.]